MYKTLYISIFAACLLFTAGCKKFLEVAPPISSITTDELFADSKQAEWAVVGLYSKMIHGLDPLSYGEAPHSSFAAGLSTIMGGVSSDELSIISTATLSGDLPANQNKLTLANPGKTKGIWTSAFKLIYDANAVLEGLNVNSASNISDSIRNQLRGEALALRAFAYFYLVNFFGELPLAITTDFNQTNRLSRSPVTRVYEQIKSDLITARSLLNADLSVSKNEKIRVNKWFAEAMLARVSLYTGDYLQAITSATEVINQTGLYSIEFNIDNVFLKNSPEAIFQLQPNSQHPEFGFSIPEAVKLLGPQNVGADWLPYYALSNDMASAFEAGDKRKSAWTKPVNGYSLPAKYKNSEPYTGNGQTEYYTVIRLAEMYLVRAEATVLMTPGSKNNAINDLNILRGRAGVDALDQSLTAEQVVEAIAHERRVELFAEWGHRWFDLKRTGKASAVLSAIAYKQPWWGDFQLLYPIPPDEILYNANLAQNPEYNNR